MIYYGTMYTITSYSREEDHIGKLQRYVINSTYLILNMNCNYSLQIPFSKFFLSSKGRIQDRQNPLPLNKITNFGISAGDKINGPFNLEIDYVGLEFDPNHREVFAYEMYQMDKYIVAT